MSLIRNYRYRYFELQILLSTIRSLGFEILFTITTVIVLCINDYIWSVIAVTILTSCSVILNYYSKTTVYHSMLSIAKKTAENINLKEKVPGSTAQYKNYLGWGAKEAYKLYVNKYRRTFKSLDQSSSQEMVLIASIALFIGIIRLILSI